MQMLPAKTREESCTERYSIGLRIENGEHLINLWKSNIFEAQAILPAVNSPELYFLYVESTNSIKRRITHQRVTRDGCIWKGIWFMNACRVN